MVKLLFVDVETTGVDERENGLIQLSGAAQERSNNFETIKSSERFNFNIRPFDGDVVTDEALQVCGLTRNDLENPHRWRPEDANDQFKHLLDKFVSKFNKRDKFFLVGFNATFDDRFLRAWFTKCGEKFYGSYVSWPPIDIAQIAAIKLGVRRFEMQNFKLATVAAEVGIPVDASKLHDAQYDIDLTIALFDWVFASVHNDAQ